MKRTVPENLHPQALQVLAVTPGVFRGFAVLLIGGLSQPLVAMVIPPVGAIWLALVAVVAFGWAAKLAVEPEGSSVREAVSAAVGAYVLVLPLVYMASNTVDVLQVLLTTLTAVVVAAAVALIAERRIGVRS
jgi:hypothetical protein